MRKTIIMILCVATLLGVCAGLLHWWGTNTFGGYNPNSSHDVQKLFTIAENSRPLRDALERFKHDKNGYPNVVTNLFPSYLQAAPIWLEDWHYELESTNGYILHYQTGWDDALCYEHLVSGANDWYYWNGVTRTDLTQKFQQF